ncbi:MAG: alpha/beta hydrolase [Myxococcota bacterium]|nr:alpha/beta hydrolase [Myxococcota bacterium]
MVVARVLVSVSFLLTTLRSPTPADAEPAYQTNVGPSESTYVCQTAVHGDYQYGFSILGLLGLGTTGSVSAIDPPLSIDPYAPLPADPAFEGVQKVTLAPGVVTKKWECTADNGCYDDDPLNPRGAAILWVPDGIEAGAPRVLFVHGGSWYYGSPWTDGYPTFAAKLAKRLGMSVLSIDYTLTPMAHYNKMLRQVGRATRFLAKHEPLELLAGNLKKTRGAKYAPPLYIIGDSSGGGTALSALVAQASPQGLPNAGQARLSGGVLFSPWINLLSNSPTYLSNLYTVHRPGDYPLGDVAFGEGSVEEIVDEYQANAEDYLGRVSMENPSANPFFAPTEWLKDLVPVSIHVGQPELLLSDAAIFTQKAALSGAAVEFHQYDGMWHDFPMYEEGCGSGEPVVLAQSAYTAARDFLQGLTQNRELTCKGTPCFYGHYEYPQGQDTAAGASSFAD